MQILHVSIPLALSNSNLQKTSHIVVYLKYTEVDFNFRKARTWEELSETNAICKSSVSKLASKLSLNHFYFMIQNHKL